MTKWIEDWFGSKYYSFLYKHRDGDEAKLFIDNLLKFLKIPSNSKVLDCGCGKGRHSFYLSEKGFDVTGIDISESNIIESKKNEKNSLAFFTHDMRNLFRINYYDVALNLFTSFGYFDKDSENDKVIKSTVCALKKGGWFILDFMNVEKETKKLAPKEKTEIEGIEFNITRSTQNNFIIKEIAISDHGKDYFFRESVKAYKREDLEKFLMQNNLVILYCFGDYMLTPFNELTSDRLILAGKKQ